MFAKILFFFEIKKKIGKKLTKKIIFLYCGLKIIVKKPTFGIITPHIVITFIPMLTHPTELF